MGNPPVTKPTNDETRAFAVLAKSAQGEVLVAYLKRELASLDKVLRTEGPHEHSAGKAYVLADLIEKVEGAPSAIAFMQRTQQPAPAGAQRDPRREL